MTNEELVALIQAGERDRLPELWDQVERFVAWQARARLVAMGPDNAASAGVEFGDLYNSGYFALVNAVKYFDQARERSFTGLLAMCLKSEFASVCGIRTSKRDPLNISSSMDAKLKGDDDNSSTFGDFIPDPKAAQALQAVDDGIYQVQTRQAVRQALEQLPVEERLAIKAHYYEDRTVKESGGAGILERAEMHLRRLLADQWEGTR